MYSIYLFQHFLVVVLYTKIDLNHKLSKNNGLADTQQSDSQQQKRANKHSKRYQ